MRNTSRGNVETSDKSHTQVSQHTAKTHRKRHVTSHGGDEVELSQNKLTSFTVSFIVEKEINEGNFNINEVQ